MPRVPRIDVGGLIYHVMNRGVGRQEVFVKDGDYAAFERLMVEAQIKHPMRICAYCLMPNHWHMILWPEQDGQVSAFLQYLTGTHAVRWQTHWNLVGTGHLYQGRYKTFIVDTDRYLQSALRYVERNPLRANLVARAEKWQWSSLSKRDMTNGHASFLTTPPISLPKEWIHFVNASEPQEQLDAIRECAKRGRPFGDEKWVEEQIEKFGLMASIRSPGRPSKPE